MQIEPNLFGEKKEERKVTLLERDRREREHACVKTSVRKSSGVQYGQ